MVLYTTLNLLIIVVTRYFAIIIQNMTNKYNVILQVMIMARGYPAVYKIFNISLTFVSWDTLQVLLLFVLY